MIANTMRYLQWDGQGGRPCMHSAGVFKGDGGPLAFSTVDKT